MTAPGELNRRLALQAPAESDDGAGGVSLSYQTVATLWAKVTPLASGADVVADSRGASLRFAIVIRRRGDVTTRHRFTEGTRVYSVLAVQESADRRFLEIAAEARGD